MIIKFVESSKGPKRPKWNKICVACGGGAFSTRYQDLL
jgi:hypothetical protein